MKIQSTTKASAIKTRSTVTRERQYAKYVSIGKGPRGKMVQTDPVSKKLTFEPRKTPTRAAKAKSRYSSTSITRSGRLFSQISNQTCKPGSDEKKSPQPAARLSFSSMTSPMRFAPSRVSSFKKSALKNRSVLSPLIPFSPNLTRNRPVPSSQTKKSVQNGRNLIDATPKKQCTPLAKVIDSTVDSPLGGASIGTFPFEANEVVFGGDCPMNVYVSFVTGFEEYSSRTTPVKQTSRFDAIVFSPSQDKSGYNPFHSPWSPFPGMLVASRNNENENFVLVENPDEIDIVKLDAELGEFDLFGDW